MDEKRTFLGRGWAFPPAFEENAQLKMVEAEKDIKESLFILLSTLPGERLMNLEYGCDLHSQVFSTITSNTIVKIESMVAEAILYYEPRINLNAVEVDDSEAIDGKLKIEIQYTVKATNSRSNMVYPFYIKEGTLITDM